MNRQKKDMRDAAKLMGKAAFLLGKSGQIAAMVELAKSMALLTTVLDGMD